jgi:hypothetical protein
MSISNTYAPVGLADGDRRTIDGADSAAPAADSREITGHFANEVLVAGEWLAIDEFIVGVLRRAHQTIEPLRSPSEARTILRLAHLFADELERTDLPFDRLRFIHAATEDASHA